MNLFDAIFEHSPSAPAIRCGQRELTYGDLRAGTVRMAQAIVSLGAVRGDRVALLLHDSPEFIEAFIAKCCLGPIALPIFAHPPSAPAIRCGQRELTYGDLRAGTN